MLWSFIKVSQIIYKEMYEYQCGEFVCLFVAVVLEMCQNAKCSVYVSTAGSGKIRPSFLHNIYNSS